MAASVADAEMEIAAAPTAEVAAFRGVAAAGPTVAETAAAAGTAAAAVVVVGTAAAGTVAKTVGAAGTIMGHRFGYRNLAGGGTEAAAVEAGGS